MNVMTRAWELYKSANCTTRYEFSVALKIAHMMVKVDKIESQLFMLDMIDCQSASDKQEVRKLQDIRNELQNKIGVWSIIVTAENQQAETDAYDYYQDVMFNLSRLVRAGKCGSDEYINLKLELQSIKSQYKFIA